MANLYEYPATTLALVLGFSGVVIACLGMWQYFTERNFKMQNPKYSINPDEYDFFGILAAGLIVASLAILLTAGVRAEAEKVRERNIEEIRKIHK